MTTDDISMYSMRQGQASFEEVEAHYKVKSVTISATHILVSLRAPYYPDAIRISRAMGDGVACFRLLEVLAR